MKKNILPILTIVSCILTAFCLVQILDLKNQLVNTENNLNNQISYMENSVYDMSRNVNEKLEKEASLLAESHWRYGKLNPDTREVMLECVVTPKEYHPGNTTASIICNDVEYEMLLENGEYIAYVSIPLVEESSVTKVQLKEGDTVRAEALEWYISPRQEFLPEVYANYEGSTKNQVKEKSLSWTFDGELCIQVDHKGGMDTIEEAYLVEIFDGKETKRTKIPLKTEALKKDRYDHAEVEGYPEKFGTEFFYHSLEKTFKVPFGSTLGLYVDVVDEYGLHYRAPFEGVQVDQKGGTESINDLYWGGEASIYDKDGNLLYSPGR